MIEYTDRNFGPIEDLSGILKRWMENGIPNDVRALHIGSRRELEERRFEVLRPATPIEDRIDELESRINNMERKAAGEIAVYSPEDLARYERELCRKSATRDETFPTHRWTSSCWPTGSSRSTRCR